MRVLIGCCLPAVLGIAVWATSDAGKTGYVNCPSGDRNGYASVYLNTCGNRPALRVRCGEEVTVLGHEGQWLKVLTTHGFQRYVRADTVSQEQGRFVAFDSSAVPVLAASDCSGVSSRTNVRQPRLISQAWPEYSDEARRKHVEGIVTLSLTVGTDGLPRDVRVEKGLGYGLDENAVRSVEQYRFEPGERDGQPVEMTIHVEVSFHTFGKQTP
jgi:TonB family protein